MLYHRCRRSQPGFCCVTQYYSRNILKLLPRRALITPAPVARTLGNRGREARLCTLHVARMNITPAGSVNYSRLGAPNLGNHLTGRGAQTSPCSTLRLKYNIISMPVMRCCEITPAKCWARSTVWRNLRGERGDACRMNCNLNAWHYLLYTLAL